MVVFLVPNESINQTYIVFLALKLLAYLEDR